MFSRSPAKLASAAMIAALALLAGCNKAPQKDETAATNQATPAAAAGPIDPRVVPYLNSKPVVMEGMALFKKYNCNGCHSNGGGGMAPALMDAEWIYGGRIEDIHATIVEGRPNGMPKWDGKIPDAEIWKIATYVRSMSLPETLAAAKNNTPSQDPAPVPASVETQ